MTVESHEDKKKFEVLKTKTLYQGIYGLMQYTIRHSLFEGGMSDEFSREVLVRSPASAVLPYDPIRDEVVLVEQFRVGAMAAQREPWLTEIIAGIKEEGEPSEDLVIREAKEEANCTITKLHPIIEYYTSPGGTNEVMSLFCGLTDTTHIGGIHGLKKEGENIKSRAVAFADAYKMVADGKINASPPIIALLWLKINRDMIRSLWR